ncbi:hypothetical protein OsI_15402 [Oryza sativa Indica Group]|uniref:Uncharacterized protein n=1 Tax=Oryza sativa subsp. indica TaxID=39946 RepID=A2XS08_ORYSI|nr:hypothetical protein OsI_15402 [Oryza sativa Indica Group]
MPKSNTKVVVLVAAVTFTVFLLLTVPAIASDEQNPVGSSTAALTVHGGTPLQQGGDSKTSSPCKSAIGSCLSRGNCGSVGHYYVCEPCTKTAKCDSILVGRHRKDVTGCRHTCS